MNLFGSPAMVSRFASLEDDFGQLGKFTILHPSRAHELIVKYSDDMTRTFRLSSAVSERELYLPFI